MQENLLIQKSHVVQIIFNYLSCSHN